MPVEVAQELHDLARTLNKLDREGVGRSEARLIIQEQLQARTVNAITAQSLDGTDMRFATPALQRYFGTDPVDPVTISVRMHLLLDDAMWALLCTHQWRPWTTDPFDSMFSYGNTTGVCSRCGAEAAHARMVKP